MNKFRILEKMKTVSSPQLTKPKTQKNKPTNSSEQRTDNEPPNNSVELPGLNTIKKCLTKLYNGTVEELELITKNCYYSRMNITPKYYVFKKHSSKIRT